MGVNAVELQPLMEFDGDGEAYHWGYMSTNFFAPASAYSSDKRTLKQLTELPSMVHAFHDK
jgi:pullulanase/glycogen debranching enzyme